MKTLLKIILLLFVLNAFQSCSKDDAPTPEPIAKPEPEPEPEPDPILPEVTSMSPLSGPKTTIVKFTGTDFGSDASKVQVFFDDIASEIQNVTETEITTVVPPRAFFGEAKLVINGTEITGFNFDYQIVDIQVTTIAGDGTQGNADGNGTNAEFLSPLGVTIDAMGTVYVSDNVTIRQIMPNGEVTTLAGDNENNGFADGVGSNALFNFIIGIVTDSQGTIYVADAINHKIRKITPSGVVSTLAGNTEGFADGTGSNAQFNAPIGLAIDAANNIYVTDTGNHKIRKITPDGLVSTIAGSVAGFADGNGANAEFDSPVGISIDTQDNIYVSDLSNFKIRKIAANGTVSTVAGSDFGFTDGNASNAQFSNPYDIAMDKLGNIYVADLTNHSIRKITPDGLVTTIAGTGVEGFADGNGANAQFFQPRGLVVDADFNIYVADTNNFRIRKITQE